MRRFIRKLSVFGFGLLIAAVPLAASAQTSNDQNAADNSGSGSRIVVTPNQNDGWSTADTRPGGLVQYVYDPSSPLPNGALQLLTDNTDAAKVQYMHTANTALSSVNTLGYSTLQNTASSPTGDPSYQLAVCLNGVTDNACTGGSGMFTTLVYEPYWNGTVTPGSWQTWAVNSGQFWSSNTVNAGGTCTVAAGHGGQPFYTLATLQSICPNAVAVGFGVNVGTYNRDYVVETDQIVFNQYTYDFQLTNGNNSDRCKSGGWQDLKDSDGNSFKNQGQCVSYMNNGKNNQHGILAATAVHYNNQNTIFNKMGAGQGQVQGANTTNNSATNNSQSNNQSNNQSGVQTGTY